MLPYILLLLFIMFLGLLAREFAFRGSTSPAPFVAIACLTIALMAGLRAPTVGADTQNYQSFFVWISTVPLDDLATADTIYWNSSGTELTYKIFNKVLSVFSTNPQTITFVCGLLLGFLLYKFVMEQSADPWLSVLLFVCLGFFQTAMNIAPSVLAALCSLLGFKHIRESNPIRYFLYIALGCVFHYSALLFIPLYYLAKRRWRVHSVFVSLVFIFLIMPFAYPAVASVLRSIVPTRWSQYLLVDRIDLSQLLVWCMLFGLFFIVTLISREADNDERACSNMMLLLVGFAYSLTMYSTSFSRVAILFAPYFIVALPNISFHARDGWLNERIGKLVPKNLMGIYANHCKTLLVILVIASYVLRLLVNNIGQTLPYYFCV